jgi:hypothetical protein
VYRNLFEPLSSRLGPLGSSRVCPSATKTFKAALRSYGHLGRDRQRNGGLFSGIIRDVSNPREGSTHPNLPLSVPTGVQSSLLHPRSSGKVNCANFRCTAFSEVHTIPIGSLSPFSDSPAKVRLFRGSAVVPTILSLLSRAPKGRPRCTLPDTKELLSAWC